MWAYAYEKSFSQIWRELTKKGWTLLRYCRIQGWLVFAPAPFVRTVDDAAPIAQDAAPPADTPVAALDAVPQGEALRTPPESASTPPLLVRAEPTSTTSIPLVQETDSSVPANTVQSVPENTVDMQDYPESATVQATNLPRAAGRGISLDDFDSDNFLDALRRDRLFERTDPEDLNIGDDDWLLALDSDAEGDEDSIRQDENDEEGDPVADFDEGDESDDNEGGEFDSVPVEFDLTGDDLDRLQADEWETYDEHHASQLRHDALPLYDGPFGPTRAALAYAENPLAIFYFFLPKELWRKIATQTNKFRLDSIDGIVSHMRARARQRRERAPSTIVMSVDEYKTKLKRKSPIQPHEIVRFIGLLVARALEPRRENLDRHWITRVEGALSRGTFGQFLRRDRFHDLARYLHFNNNEKQADSGDRAFKVRPVTQALQKTFFRGYRLGARISFDEGMVPMRHRRNPMRQYMRAKPNKWGTKFYLTCCADSAYCSRYEIHLLRISVS
ncbi:unnamed protein product [Phytophthora fragariaefolia]|uniref:Unnamed protein product n=1 Tax=Phytophthora fragariaefolia TaxID=1490495 RepID=A0A9W6YBU4_9STRA|nr:unnamed protein product [Phytophthora fragariaefolia]